MDQIFWDEFDVPDNQPISASQNHHFSVNKGNSECQSRKHFIMPDFVGVWYIFARLANIRRQT